MKKMNKKNFEILCKSLWVLLIIASFAVSALADEMWSSEFGIIIYEDDIGNTAVFGYATPGFQNSRTQLFIKGLVPDVYGNRTRGTYSGYWIDNSNRQICEAALVSPKGTRSQSWGQIELTFRKDGIGGWNAWIATLGDCFEKPTRKLIADSYSETVNSGQKTNVPPPNDFNKNPRFYLITENSVGGIQIGMTVAQARQAMSGITFSRTDDGDGVALIAVTQEGEKLMTIYAGEENSVSPINENAKIEQIEVWSAKFKTAGGVHPKMKISDVEQIYHKVKSQFTSEIESRQFVEFTNQPKNLTFRQENTDWEALDKDIANDVSTEGKSYTINPYILSITISKPFHSF